MPQCFESALAVILRYTKLSFILLISVQFCVRVLLQVNLLIKEYHREHMTAWGNASSVVVEKLYKTVRLGLPSSLTF
jgi:hypothetical protein